MRRMVPRADERLVLIGGWLDPHRDPPTGSAWYEPDTNGGHRAPGTGHRAPGGGHRAALIISVPALLRLAITERFPSG